MMFLVTDQRKGHAVFTLDDPRDYGVVEGVEADIILEEDDPQPGLWMDGEEAPARVLGVDPHDHRRHRVFRTQRERIAAGFKLVGGVVAVVVVSTLAKYRFAGALPRAACSAGCGQPATHFAGRNPYCEQHAPRRAHRFKTLPA
jgi:hypothetical protein